MVERGAEPERVRESYQASLRQMGTLLEAQARLRAVAEEGAAETRRELERLAEALCPALVDGLRKDRPGGLAELSVRQLVDRLIGDVQARLDRLRAAEVAERTAGERCHRAVEELGRLRARNAELERQVAGLRRRAERAELEKAVLQQAPEDGAVPVEPGPAAAPASLPDWIRAWRAEATFERDLGLLEVLADTGAGRRSDVARLAVERTGVAHGGAVTRLFGRCQRQGLIELIELSGDGQGDEGPVHLVRLTDRGQDGCRLLLGREPAPSQATALLERAGGPAGALLVLRAGDLLRRAGYRVDLLPGEVDVPGEPVGRRFRPDLVASLNGAVRFVQVEGPAPRGFEERSGEWQAYYDVAGGHLCVVTPDDRAQEAVRGQLLYWAGRRPLVLWMTSLDRAGGRQGEAVWVFKRGG